MLFRSCQLFFSSIHWFTTKSATPYWLTIGDENFKRSEPILNALAHWDPENTYDDQPIAAYAIRLEPGMDRQTAVDHIVAKAEQAINIAVSACAKNEPET